MYSRALARSPSSAYAAPATACASESCGSSWQALTAILLAERSGRLFTMGAPGANCFWWRSSAFARPTSARTFSFSKPLSFTWPVSSHFPARENRRMAHSALLLTSLAWPSMASSMLHSARSLYRASSLPAASSEVLKKSSPAMRSARTLLMPSQPASPGPRQGSRQDANSTSTVMTPRGRPSGRAPSASFRTAEPPVLSRRTANSTHSGASPSPQTKRLGSADSFSTFPNFMSEYSTSKRIHGSL
mmetsp:Transcript_115958/g.322943  ORF Transcript_115958/g.322943 Transcript_115958/m.322943 type:complete len:246 (+) Transcript_115958:444-1181(+)